MSQNQPISVNSLGSGNQEGYLTKCGGTIKTWKKRWFVLKGDTLFYFKTPKDTDLTGSIALEESSECKEDLARNKTEKGKYYFSISTSKRLFVIYSDTEQLVKEWVQAINAKIQQKQIAGGVAAGGAAFSPQKGDEQASQTKGQTGGSKSLNPNQKARAQLYNAKAAVPFLQDEDSKVVEFWQIWYESIPSGDDMQSLGTVGFHVSLSSNFEKMTWRTDGPQNVFIQKMVDFFWNVGAPESEIDRLNEVGALINPFKIGSWIDMSLKGGMDGGWYFPVEVLLKVAIKAADMGDPATKMVEWAEKHLVEKCYNVGRDMGAAPPRQTEIRVMLPGNDFDAQIACAKDAYRLFGFSFVPDPIFEVISEWKPLSLCLSIISSSEGFVRIGLICPKPTAAVVSKLYQASNASNEKLAAFESAMRSSGPASVEFQYVSEGFGYGVYKEGFDVVYHYFVGEDKI